MTTELREKIARAHFDAWRANNPGTLTWEAFGDAHKQRFYDTADVSIAALSSPPAEDVREALDHLDALNESGRIQYADYAVLHDMVSRIDVRQRGTFTETPDDVRIGLLIADASRIADALTTVYVPRVIDMQAADVLRRLVVEVARINGSGK